MATITLPNRPSPASAIAATMTSAIISAWSSAYADTSTQAQPSADPEVKVSAGQYRVSTSAIDVQYVNAINAIDSIEWKVAGREVLKGISNLSTEAQQSLGPHNVERLAIFIDYPDGWAGGDGRALSPLSLAVLDSFLQHYARFATEPSLFLTTRGTLELAWETPQGSAINLEFLPSEIEYFVEADDDEGVARATHRDITALKEKLSNLGA